MAPSGKKGKKKPRSSPVPEPEPEPMYEEDASALPASKITIPPLPYSQQRESPYKSSPIYLHIADEVYVVSESLLHRYPLLIGDGLSEGWSHYKAHLDVSPDIAHTLVHYIYTQNYETVDAALPLPFDPTESDVQEYVHTRDQVEFVRAMRVYAAASKYQVDGLSQLAKEQMKVLGETVPISQVLDVAREVYPQVQSGEDETWLENLVRKRLLVAFGEQGGSLRGVMAEYVVGNGGEFDQVVVGAVLEIYEDAGGREVKVNGEEESLLRLDEDGLVVPEAEVEIPFHPADDTKGPDVLVEAAIEAVDEPNGNMWSG